MSKPFSKENMALRLYEFLSSKTRTIKDKTYYQGLDIDAMISTAEHSDPVFKKRATGKSHSLTPLPDVPENAPLVSDITDEAGGVLLTAGTILCRQTLKRLAELAVTHVDV